MARMIRPTLAEMARRGTPFRGVLFAGLMLTAEGPKLLEYNVRFGDPETQAMLPRLRSDLLAALLAACDGELGRFDLRWSAEAALVVVLAARGYPAAPETGSVIDGVEEAAAVPGAHIFHAGTRREPRRAADRRRRASAECGRHRAGSAHGAGCGLCRGGAHPLAGRLLAPRHRLAGAGLRRRPLPALPAHFRLRRPRFPTRPRFQGDEPHPPRPSPRGEMRHRMRPSAAAQPKAAGGSGRWARCACQARGRRCPPASAVVSFGPAAGEGGCRPGIPRRAASARAGVRRGASAPPRCCRRRCHPRAMMRPWNPPPVRGRSPACVVSPPFFLSLLLAAPRRGTAATERIGAWLLSCTTDRMTDRTSCRLQHRDPVDGSVPPLLLEIVERGGRYLPMLMSRDIGLEGAGASADGPHRHSRKCAFPPPACSRCPAACMGGP